MKSILGTQKITGLFLAFISILLILSPSYADKVKQPIHAKKLVPACLLYWTSGPEYAVLVDKSRQKVLVYKRGDLFNPFRVYNCSTGENKGSKQRKNDRKTPEGIYYFIKSYEDKYLAPIYGTKALPLNYPNLIDKKNGKGGYGIWFHGTNKSLKPNDTNGCIAMKNSDIEDLADIVSLFKTPVIVASKVDLVSVDQMENKKNNIANIIEDWRRSWEAKDIDEYMSHYSKKFVSGWKDWWEWKEHKARLAKKYSRIGVEVNDLNLFYHDEVIIASFEQVYRTPSLDSFGTKKLYMTQNSTEWKIIGETFRGKDKPKVIARKTPDFNKTEIEDFLFSWKNSWEKKDLSGYISCYDTDFKSRGMGLREWKDHRRKLNDKYSTIKVDIKNIKIESIESGKKAKVSFIQNYRAGNYRDRGKKKILLIRKGKYWKIKEEIWTKIR